MQGITTPRALERAYKKDVQLFWRLLRAFTAVLELDRTMHSYINQIVTYSDYYRPWFNRYRVCFPLKKIRARLMFSRGARLRMAGPT